MNELIYRIEDFFKENDNDGEFVVGVRSIPYSLIGPTESTENFIFTTKPAIVETILQDKILEKTGMIGRYGLPQTIDLDWIRRLQRNGSLLFLGDMDPVDLLIFVWLRENLRPQTDWYFEEGCLPSPKPTMTF